MSNRRILMVAASALIASPGLALAQQSGGPAPSGTSPAGTAGEMRKGEMLKAGEMGGGSGNTGVPGASPAADGNKTQDSRTTHTRDR